MPTVVVLFKLKPGVDVARYQAWARGTDLKVVRQLKSVDDFAIYRAAGLLGGGAAPYDYIEVIRVNDMAAFGRDVASDTIQKVAAEFREFADDPQFILTDAL